MSLVLKYQITVIQSQSRGDNAYMDAGTPLPFPLPHITVNTSVAGK